VAAPSLAAVTVTKAWLPIGRSLSPIGPVHSQINVCLSAAGLQSKNSNNSPSAHPYACSLLCRTMLSTAQTPPCCPTPCWQCHLPTSRHLTAAAAAAAKSYLQLPITHHRYQFAQASVVWLGHQCCSVHLLCMISSGSSAAAACHLWPNKSRIRCVSCRPNTATKCSPVAHYLLRQLCQFGPQLVVQHKYANPGSTQLRNTSLAVSLADLKTLDCCCCCCCQELSAVASIHMHMYRSASQCCVARSSVLLCSPVVHDLLRQLCTSQAPTTAQASLVRIAHTPA
jgi:hypothetical protein